MQRLGQLFSFTRSSSNNPPKDTSKNNSSNLKLFPSEEEHKNSSSELEKINRKLDKYRTKYKIQREKYLQDLENSEGYTKKLEENNLRIQSLNKEIRCQKEKNTELNRQISEKKKQIEELNEKINKQGKEESMDYLDVRPSLSSLQYENLKEKLNAKNKRVQELEAELFKESQKTETLTKEIALLKSQINSNN